MFNRRHSSLAILFCVALFGTACSDDSSSNNGSTDLDAGTDASQVDDSGTPDANVAPDAAVKPDGATDGCVQASVTGDWELTLYDDVSVEYSAVISPRIEGSERVISLLFERYSPGPDVGTFDLSEEPDSNFGTCAHCVFVRTDGRERVYFPETGVLENTKDPYSRRPEFSVTGLKLIEAEVDGVTRESTPIPDGACIEVADFEGSGVFPPSRWSCPAEAYNDDMECNCECGEVDPDCGTQGDCRLGDPDCEQFELPVVGCAQDEVCSFEPADFTNACIEPCDWEGRDGCSAGTCVFDFGVGDGDLCISNNLRIAEGVGLGESCPDTGFQVLCNIVDGFAEGYCGPNGTCRSICTSNDDCTEPDHTCRQFVFENPLGYCGPEPVDG